MKWIWHQGHTWKTSKVYSLPTSYFFFHIFFFTPLQGQTPQAVFWFTHVFTPIWFITQKWILKWNIHREFFWLSAKSVWRQSLVCLFGVKSCQLWYGWQLVWKQHKLAKLTNHCPALKMSSSYKVAHIMILILGYLFVQRFTPHLWAKYHHTFKTFSGLNCEVRILNTHISLESQKRQACCE